MDGGPNSRVMSGALMPTAVSAHMSMNTSWPSHIMDSREKFPSGCAGPGMSRRRRIRAPYPTITTRNRNESRNPLSPRFTNECTEKSASTPLRVRNEA